MDFLRRCFREMKGYRIFFTPESAKCISRLHPDQKKIVRTALDRLRKNPFEGDDLQEELAAFKSLKPKRLRIIYTVEEREKLIRVYYVGHRKDVYDRFRLLLKALSTNNK